MYMYAKTTYYVGVFVTTVYLRRSELARSLVSVRFNRHFLWKEREDGITAPTTRHRVQLFNRIEISVLNANPSDHTTE